MMSDHTDLLQMKRSVTAMAYTFSGGLDLQKNGRLPAADITKMPDPERLILRMPDEGAEAFEPCVGIGDEVAAYQSVADLVFGDDRIPVYTGIAGRVSSFITEKQAVVGLIIEADGSGRSAELHGFDGALSELSPETITEMIKNAAIPCRGSYGYVYRRIIATGGQTSRFILNCCESEPGVTSRRKLVCEDPETVIAGTKLIMRALDVRRCEITAEKDNPVCSLLRPMIKKDPLFELRKVKRKYPQDEELSLIYAVTGIRLSDADRPERSACCVIDAETAAAVYRAVVFGIPYCERVVSVDENNVLCPVGTPVSSLLEYCSVDPDRASLIILGGPLRGTACRNGDDPIGPLTDAVTVIFPGDGAEIPEMSPCTHCGRCVAVCPSKIMPYHLAAMSMKKKYRICADYGISACTGCGCCDYVCPAFIPVKKLIKTAKQRLAKTLKE